MKAIPNTLVVNTRSGYCLTPERCGSIAEAVRKAKESCGFAYRIFVNNRVVKSGYCE